MLHFVKKLTNTSAQHSVEYAVIMILVMASIIISGPFVIRHWNANMQGWEDSVIDSLDDPLLEAPNVVTIPLCSCREVVGNPNFDCGLGGCGQMELLNRCVCAPIGCGFSTGTTSPCVEGVPICNCHPLCCSTPVPTGLCGPAASPPCPDGQMRVTYSCGGTPPGGCVSTPQTSCQPDPACTFDCITPLVEPPNSSRCPGFGIGLTVDTNITLVDSCTLPTAHCQIVCDPPNFPVLNYTACSPCQPGTVLVGNCGATLTCEKTLVCSQGECQAS